MNWLKNILAGGFRIGFSTGKPFDPRDQKRTDALQDLAKQAKEEEAKNDEKSK
jgi:hypothetical protein